MVGGSLTFGWGMMDMAAIYIWMAVLMAITLRMSPNQAVNEFIAGMKTMLMAASIVCVAKAVSSILTAGTIIDTIIYGLSFILKAVPTILQGPAMYMINIVINIFITSGSGQAAVVIPIVAPLADMIGITKTDCCTGIQLWGWFLQLYSSDIISTDGNFKYGKCTI